MGTCRGQKRGSNSPKSQEVVSLLAQVLRTEFGLCNSVSVLNLWAVLSPTQGSIFLL